MKKIFVLFCAHMLFIPKSRDLVECWNTGMMQNGAGKAEFRLLQCLWHKYKLKVKKESRQTITLWLIEVVRFLDVAQGSILWFRPTKSKNIYKRSRFDEK